jgi:hypothetical protein
MKTIETTGNVSQDRMMIIRVPQDITPGEHKVVVVIDENVQKLEKKAEFDLPAHDFGPWPEGLSLRREDMYDGNGR